MSSGITGKVSHIGKQAIVIGAGISGLAAARALAGNRPKSSTQFWNGF